MQIEKTEIAIVGHVDAISEVELHELNELQLAIVAGGSGVVVIA